MTIRLVDTTSMAALTFAAGKAVASARAATLTEGALRTMFMSKMRMAFGIVAAVGLVGIGAGLIGNASPADPPKAGTPKTVPSDVLLDGFDKLSPAKRWRRIEKTTSAAKECEAVVRGDLVRTSVVARGSLQSARPGDVICKVRAGPKGTNGIAIKSLVDNGEQVKKGELIVQLDDSTFVEQLKSQKIVLDTARGDLLKARDEVVLVSLDNEASTLSCEIDIRTAERALKKNLAQDVKDVDEAAILKLNVELAKVHMARAKVLGRARLALAQTALDAKKAIVETEQAQARDIEQQIQACRLVATQDGIVVYFVPAGTRVNDGSMVIAQGELVREGQKVIQVPDLTQMLVSVRVPEALVSNLRSEDPKDKNGPQAARIRMDALPNRVFKGHVKVVDTVAEQTSIHDPHFDDIHYRVLVSIDDKPDGLNPFMSAEVTIDTGAAAGVLQVPLLAVVRAGRKEYCYVKRGKEIHKTAVTAGLRSDARAEIRSGLKEGDEVLRDPVGLLRRLK